MFNNSGLFEYQAAIRNQSLFRGQESTRPLYSLLSKSTALRHLQRKRLQWKTTKLLCS